MDKEALKQYKRQILLVLGILILLALITVTGKTSGTAPEGYVPAAYSTVFSLLPPIVAITLALLTKEVYSSLFIGIATGALLYAGGNLELAFTTMLYHEDGGLVMNLTDASNMSVLTFVVILGTMVVLVNRSGGARAFGSWASAHIKSKIGAQLAAMAMGILIFIDDGFNCMTVGSVMRPITDEFRVSRAKLAYIIDSTAAPICIIAPISCWAAAVTYSVPADSGINGFQMFLETIPFNFYALCTLALLLLAIVFGFDFGPMKKFEEAAGEKDISAAEQVRTEDPEQPVGKLADLVVPVAVLIVCCILGILYTGGFFRGVGLIDAFSEAESGKGLVYGSMLALLFTLCFYMYRGTLSFSGFMESLAEGFRTMCAPMIILILAWNLSGMTGLLGAKYFIRDLVDATAGGFSIFLPCIIFLISVFLAFSTGTSWGTFSILIPIVCNVFPDAHRMLVISIAACLSGAVCGDHCSPISDTTIMSSAGAGCNHVDHVASQLPYAMLSAGVSAVGYLAAGAIAYRSDGAGAFTALPATMLLLLGAVVYIRRSKVVKNGKKPSDS